VGRVKLEFHLVYLALRVGVSYDSFPLKFLSRYGDLDQGSNIAAKEGDGDEGVFVSWLLQVKLHEAVMHTVRSLGSGQQEDFHFLRKWLYLDTTLFHQPNSWTGKQKRVKTIQTLSSKKGLVVDTGKGHEWTGILQGTDVEVHSPHVITDQVTVACMNEGGTAGLVLASIDKVVHVSNRNPDTQIVSICVDGLHEAGISRVQALLQTGFGVLRSSRVQACWDRLMSEAPFLSAAATLMDPPYTSRGSPSQSVPRVLQQGSKGKRTSPGPLYPGNPMLLSPTLNDPASLALK